MAGDIDVYIYVQIYRYIQISMSGKYWVQILGPNAKILSIQTSSAFKYQIYHRTMVWTVYISDVLREGLHLTLLNNHLMVHLNQRWLLIELHFILNVRHVFFSTKNLFSAVERMQLWSPPRFREEKWIRVKKRTGWMKMYVLKIGMSQNLLCSMEVIWQLEGLIHQQSLSNFFFLTWISSFWIHLDLWTSEL